MLKQTRMSKYIGDLFPARRGCFGLGGVFEYGDQGEGRQASTQRFQSMRMLPLVLAALTLTLTHSDHAGRTIVLNKVDGITVTLPRANGSGGKFRFFVKAAVTSVGTVIQVANADDVMSGTIYSTLVGTPTTNNGWPAASTSDTITLNGTTKGGLAGDWIELEDVAQGIWAVSGVVTQSSSAATMFSAAVS